MGKKIVCCFIALILALTLDGCGKVIVPVTASIIPTIFLTSTPTVASPTPIQSDEALFVPNPDFAGWYDTDRESAYPAIFYMGEAKEENKRIVMDGVDGFCVSKLDGTEECVIKADYNLAQFYSGWIYYLTGTNDLYKVKPDGTETTLIKSFSKKKYTRVFDDGTKDSSYKEDIYYLEIADDAIFYVVYNPIKDDTFFNDVIKLFRMDLDGGNVQFIQAYIDIFEEEGGEIWYADGKIFYVDVKNHRGDLDTDIGYFAAYDIMQYDIKSGKRETLAKDVYGFWLYGYGDRYFYGNGEGYKFQKHGTEAADLPFNTEKLWGQRYFQWLIGPGDEDNTLYAYDLSTGEYQAIPDLSISFEYPFICSTQDGIYLSTSNGTSRLFVKDGKFVVEPLKN